MSWLNFISTLPLSVSLVYVAGILGAILITYAIFLERERRRDLVMALGATGLFTFALLQNNLLFMIATAALGLGSLIAFFDIYLGLHRHSPEDLKRYKDLK